MYDKDDVDLMSRVSSGGDLTQSIFLGEDRLSSNPAFQKPTAYQR